MHRGILSKRVCHFSIVRQSRQTELELHISIEVFESKTLFLLLFVNIALMYVQ